MSRHIFFFPVGQSTGNRRDNDRGYVKKRSPYVSYKRPRSIPDRWEHDMFESDDNPGRARSSLNRRKTENRPKIEKKDCTKLLINNLDFAVTDDDIDELFVEFGPLRKVNILYNRAGLSSGTAELIYLRPEDAQEAHDQYNGVPLDGRPMEITLIKDSKSYGRRH